MWEASTNFGVAQIGPYVKIESYIIYGMLTFQFSLALVTVLPATFLKLHFIKVYMLLFQQTNVCTVCSTVVEALIKSWPVSVSG